MAIKKEDLTKLEKTLKLEEGTLTSAMESEEEISIEIPELVVRTTEENDTFIENLKTEQKTAGVEMAVKSAREKLGLSFEGKTIDNLLTAHESFVVEQKKSELGEPNAKIEELQKDITKLQGNISSLTEERDGLKNSMVQKEQSLEMDSKLLGFIPDNLNISKQDALSLFKLNHDVSFGENKEIIIKKDGVQLKNETDLSPVAPEEVMTSFTTKFLQKAEGGNGGGDEPPAGKAGSFEAFQKEMNDKGHETGSEAFNKEMNKRIANKTLEV